MITPGAGIAGNAPTFGVVRRGAAGFDPRNFGTVLEYLRPPTNLSSGDPIETLTATVGTNAGQATLAKRPTARLVSGRWWMRFDGIDDCLQVPALALPTFCTLIFVITVRTFGMYLEQSAAVSANAGCAVYGGAGGPWGFNRSGANHNCAGPGTSWTGASPLVVAVTYDGSGKYYKNLAEQANGAITGTARANTIVTDTLNIGSRNNGAGLRADADFGPIIIYDGKLSDANREAVIRAFATEYGITA